MEGDGRKGGRGVDEGVEGVVVGREFGEGERRDGGEFGAPFAGAFRFVSFAFFPFFCIRFSETLAAGTQGWLVTYAGGAEREKNAF